MLSMWDFCRGPSNIFHLCMRNIDNNPNTIRRRKFFRDLFFENSIYLLSDVSTRLSLHGKCLFLQFFWSVFPAFGLNMEIYEVSLHIQSEWRKIRTRKTPNMDTFYAVCFSKKRNQHNASLPHSTTVMN